jgi:hypothetical protein
MTLEEVTNIRGIPTEGDCHGIIESLSRIIAHKYFKAVWISSLRVDGPISNDTTEGNPTFMLMTDNPQAISI